MSNYIDLSGKTIIVTGASSGIGKSVVELLDSLGAKVVMIARREEKLQEIKNNLCNQSSCYYIADLSELDKIEEMIKTIVSEHGKISGFVHSAGIANARPLKMITPQILNSVMTINFYSFIEICRCLSKKGRYSDFGCNIVGISSASSIQGNSSKTAYAASKAAMDAAVRCMAKELANKGFRLNTVAPAMIDTEIYDSFKQYSADAEDSKMVIARQYLGVGKPENVADAVAFLLSERSSFITGTTMNLDGGRLSS